MRSIDNRRVRFAGIAFGLVLLALGGLKACAESTLPELPEEPWPQQKPDDRPLIGPANCVSTAYMTTNPEAASGALVRAKLCSKPENPFNRFLSTSEPEPLTPLQKLRLAQRDVTDRFNLLTIAANSAIYIGANAHNPYGPGIRGFSYNVGVSLSQDGTGEFFNTFLIPSIVHQDPHYHRMPGASYVRRVVHTVVSTAVMQSDSGRPIFNYSVFLGFPIDAEIADLYVPNLQTNLKATGARVAIGIVTVPIGNMISEFLPDLARHVNVHVIFVQRIINQVARGDGSNTANF